MKINKELKKISVLIKEAEHNRPYDRRKKEYKQAEKVINLLETEAKLIIAKKALERVKKNLGGHFVCELVTESYYAPFVEIRVYNPNKYEKGFEWYLIPHFSSWGREPTASYHLYKNHHKYGSSQLSDTDKLFLSKLFSKLTEGVRYQVQYIKERERNQSNANALYKVIKDQVSYKSYNHLYEEEPDKWAGDRLEVEWEDRENSWREEAKIAIEMRNEEYDIDAKLNFNLRTVNDCKNFIEEFEALVKKYTDFIKKKKTFK